MKLLIDNGFIYTEMIKSQSGTTRRIFIGSALPKNGSCALPKNDTSALPKNGSSLYIRKNIRKENIIIDSKESVEKSTNHIDVDNMLKTLKTEVGCSDFAESEVDKRKHGYNLVRLSEKI